MPDPAAWGVATRYQDYAKREQKPPRATIERILEVLGAAGDSPAEPRVRVVRAGEATRLPDVIELRTEDGGSLAVDGALPRDTPLGYHQAVERDGRVSDLIVSPGTCYLPAELHTWGWAAQLYSVRSRKSWGIGDLGDLHELGAWAKDSGAGLILLNPLHAAKPGAGQQPSPYFPSSRRFRNPLYLRVEDVPGADEAGPELENLAAQGRALNEDPAIARDEIYRLKIQALEILWERWAGSPAFESFCAEHDPALSHFATFMTLSEKLGGGPAQWPSDYRDPLNPAVEKWRATNSARVDFHRWVQWLLAEQLGRAGARIDLVHDLAVGVDPDGADAWLSRDVFARGVTVGAPPDEFNPVGQNWGLPPFDPWKLRSSGYRAFIETVRAGLSLGTGLRIDHVMGLFRLYWIPEGAEPGEGTYVAYPHEDLLNIVALESHRAGAYVIGEDLGTVEERVRREMAARNMLSYRIMWFEEGPPSGYPALSLAAVTNHDLPTIAGAWSGADLRERKDLGIAEDDDSHASIRSRLKDRLGVADDAPVEDVIERAYRVLGEGRSKIVVATLEDALAVELRPNQPGTALERPNWSLPLPQPLEELAAHPLPARIAASIAGGRRASASPGARGVEPDVEHSYADLGDVRLHYVAAGSGPLVVLLHGFPDFWLSWRWQIPPLAEAGFRVVAPDLRGYNLSDKPTGTSAYRTSALTGDVARMIEQLGEERAHVAGHDWGGILAWFLAMRRPEVVERLAIVNVNHPAHIPRGFLRPDQLLRSWYVYFFQLPFLPEKAVSANDYAALRAMLRSQSRAFDEDEIESYVEAAARTHGMSGPLSYYRAFLRRNPFGARSEMRPIEAPVLVLWGERDIALGPHLADPPADLVPHAEVVRFPNAGHWVHREEPERVNELLIDFFRSRRA